MPEMPDKATIYLERLRGKGSPSVPTTMTTGGQGKNFFIRIESQDGLRIILKADACTFIGKLNPILSAMYRSLDNDTPPGIIHDSSSQAEPEAGEEQFNLITMADIVPELPIAKKLAFLIERFRDSDADIHEALVSDYKTFTGQTYNAGSHQDISGEPSQVEQDLAILEAEKESLLNAKGQLQRGAVSRIAEMLGGQAAGHFYYSRVKPAIKALRKAA